MSTDTKTATAIGKPRRHRRRTPAAPLTISRGRNRGGDYLRFNIAQSLAATYHLQVGDCLKLESINGQTLRIVRVQNPMDGYPLNPTRGTIADSAGAVAAGHFQLRPADETWFARLLAPGDQPRSYRPVVKPAGIYFDIRPSSESPTIAGTPPEPSRPQPAAPDPTAIVDEAPVPDLFPDNTEVDDET